MNDATLAQGNQVLNLILQKKKGTGHIQALLKSGLLSDLLDADPASINRREFKRFLGLAPLVQSFEITQEADVEAIRKFVQDYGRYNFENSRPSAVPRGLVLPTERKCIGKYKLLFLDLSDEAFLTEDGEDYTRNIEEREALDEMEKRGYKHGGLFELVDFLTVHPEYLDAKAKEGWYSLIVFQTFMVDGVEKLCSVVWQSGHLSIRDKLDANAGGNCRFLATRRY